MGFQNVELKEIEDNPFREKSAYVYDNGKIDELAESMADTSYWENMLARKTKDGRIQLAYGHHRLMALKKLVEEGMLRYKEIKLNVRPERELTDERMLKIFVQENKDTWGEIPQNLCMSVLQLQAHLTGILDASKDKDEFIKRIGDAGALKIDDRAFTRAKNTGVGATMISQFLGDTWSRQTISDALLSNKKSDKSKNAKLGKSKILIVFSIISTNYCFFRFLLSSLFLAIHINKAPIVSSIPIGGCGGMFLFSFISKVITN